MATHNDVTGDSIQSKQNTEKFRNGYDMIDWGKKKQQQVMFNQHGSHAFDNKEEVKEDGDTN